MTNESSIRFAMNVLYVQDLQRSIEFYRLLGIDVADPHPERPVSRTELAPGITLIIATGEVAAALDSGWKPPTGEGYQQVTEFLVDADDEVDAAWSRLTAAGHTGITTPGHLIGPYATMVEDPDGNLVLITHEPAS